MITPNILIITSSVDIFPTFMNFTRCIDLWFRHFRSLSNLFISAQNRSPNPSLDNHDEMYPTLIGLFIFHCDFVEVRLVSVIHRVGVNFTLPADGLTRPLSSLALCSSPNDDSQRKQVSAKTRDSVARVCLPESANYR